MTAPEQSEPTGAEHIALVRDLIERQKRELVSCERMIELLQPEWDRFQAKSRYDLYVSREYADHFSAARKHRKEIAAKEYILALAMKALA